MKYLVWPLTLYDPWPLSLCLAGSSVAQLNALDPEGEPLIYGVSGEEAVRYFSVNKDTGVVWLRQQLDREVWPPSKHTGARSHITQPNALHGRKDSLADLETRRWNREWWKSSGKLWVQSGSSMYLQCVSAPLLFPMFMPISVSNRPSQRCRLNSSWATLKR